MMTPSNLLFVGIYGSVVALDRSTGQQKWSTRLKEGSFTVGNGFVNILVQGNVLYAATQGEVFCLDGLSGKILWRNEMRGYRYGLASLATVNGMSDVNQAVRIEEECRRQSEQSSATTTTD